MHVSHLTIQNYRNFTTFDIDLHPFTLVIGGNNTGKSNMLDAICLLLSQEITIFRKRILQTDDINYSVVQKFKQQVADSSIALADVEFPYVKITITLTDFNDSQEAVVGDWFTNKEMTEAKLAYIFSLRQGWQNKEEWLEKQRELANSGGQISPEAVHFPIEEYEYTINGGNGQQTRVDPYFLRMLRMELLDALRDAKRELSASGENRLLYRVLNNRDKTKFAPLQEAIVALSEKVKNDQEFNAIKTEIKAYLDKISLQENNADNTVSFKFTSPELNEILRKLTLEYGTDPIGVERNGLGRNNLLFISLVLSHLVGEMEGTNNTFFRLVGIEEPESHLHPHLQHHLSENIKEEARDDMQVILTSHSPYITSQLDLNTTHVLYKDNGQIREHKLLNGLDDNSKTVRYLKKFIDVTNSAMFFAQRVILVEGNAEQILLPKFFEIHTEGNTLESYGCSVINVHGLAFAHFLKIIKNGYFVKSVALTDQDGNQRGQDLKSEYEEPGGVIKVSITQDDTFEIDLIKANLTGNGKKTLFKALCRTKTTNGPLLETSTGDDPIDPDLFFDEIEDYKTEFAFDLLTTLNEPSNDLALPDYIIEAFDHILDGTSREEGA